MKETADEGEAPFVGATLGRNGRLRRATVNRGYRSGNHVLDALSRADRAGLKADLEIIALAKRVSTQSRGTPVDHVDFPINAVVSVVATLGNGDEVEVGTVGTEAFVESDAALDSHLSQRGSFCQVRGTVARMTIERFTTRMAENGTFARAMRRNVRASLFSAQQFAACNVKHSVLRRCARWLSMTQDRVGSPTFTITHEVLAIMLGVRRPGVSEAADALQKSGAITYRRGVVTVLDRALLHATACECYGACKAAFTASLIA